MKDIHNENEIADEFEPIDEETGTDEELEDIEENSAHKITQLKKKLKESEKEKMELLENLQRAKAEFLNGKRRLEEEKLRDRERAIEHHIERLLPLCDSFHMAMSNKEAWETTNETWRKGIESIHTQLQSILASYNVVEVHPQGEEFNPEIHEALTNVPVDSKEMHHKIVSVIQNGFTRKTGDKIQLIRPARVTVGEFTQKKTD